MLAHPDARTVLRAVLKAWLPLSEAVLCMAIEHLPDPAAAAPGRLARLLPPQQLHLKGLQLSKDLQQVSSVSQAMAIAVHTPYLAAFSYTFLAAAAAATTASLSRLCHSSNSHPLQGQMPDDKPQT